MGERLHLQDCKCPICMCILIEPVRMPCNHELCMPCFKQNVEEAHFTCPICRLRISSWARKQSRLGQLVDVERWKQIQEAFPLLCQKRLNGDDEDSEYETSSPVKRNTAQPGEIRKEYEEEISKFQKIRQQEEKKAIEESEALIKRLQKEEILRYEEAKKAKETQQQTDEELAKHLAASLEEEEKWKREQWSQTTRDEELARRLQEAEQSPSAVINLSGPSTSSQKGQTPSMKCTRLEHLFNKMENKKFHRDEISGRKSTTHAFGAFSPTPLTRLPSMKDIGVSVQRTKSTESEDSITNEVCHFKPIKTSPRTARRRLADGSRDSPPIVHSTPRNLSNLKSPRSGDTTPAMKSRLVEMLCKKLPEAPTKSDSDSNRLSKEVQASPTKYSKTAEDETEDVIPDGKDSHQKKKTSLIGQDEEKSDKRRIDIQGKLNKFSRTATEELEEATHAVSKHSDCKNSPSKVSTKRKKGIIRESVESKPKTENFKRPHRSMTDENPSPQKKCKVDVKLKDQNANDILTDSNDATVLDDVEEIEDTTKVAIPQHSNGQGDDSIVCSPANGIHNSDSKSRQRNVSDVHRRSSGQNTLVKYMELMTAEQRKLRQEDIDRKIALDLQRQFEEESKGPLSSIVRTKGSEDAYPLRANRKRAYREISPSPKS